MLEELGVRFPDMSEIYDKKLQEILRQTAKEIGLDLKEGIYASSKARTMNRRQKCMRQKY